MRFIAAIDPGKTTGIAIVSLKGRIVRVASIENARLKDIIAFLMKFGKPLIIASDVNPAPHRVKSIASQLGAVLYQPRRSLRVSEKLKLVKDARINFNNYHELDALAAALKAYRRYRNFFEKLEYDEKKIETILKNKKSWVKR